MLLAKNVLKFSHTTVQLSNISQINVGRIETKIKFPLLAVIIAIISVFILAVNIIIGVLGIALSAGYIYYTYKNIPADKVYLNLNLNSGNVYNIYFADPEFAEEVRTSIENAFNGSIKAPLNIDMSSENIYEVSGDNNSFNSHNNSGNTDNSINNSGNNNSGISAIGYGATIETTKTADEFDWGIIDSNLTDVINCLKDKNSKVKIASKEALEISKTRNKSKFIEYVREHKTEFTNEVFKAVASGVLIEVFAKIIN